jgi:hypothetical protein
MTQKGAILLGVLPGLFLMLLGCNDTSVLTALKSAQALAQESPIFCIGGYFNGSRNVACYWQGTARTDLPDLPGTLNADANKGVISNGTLYSAGFCLTSAATPCYWVGTNAPVQLPVPASGFAQAIYVTGNVILTAGISGSNACYWNDTTRYDLAGGTGSTSSQATGISSWGGTIYTAGVWQNASRVYGCYWVGTNLFTLPDPTGGGNGSRTYGIFVSNGTPYTAGNYTTTSGPSVACYWVGYLSPPVGLPSIGTNSAWAYSITIDSGHIYLAGTAWDGSRYVPCYWVDGVLTLLPIPASAVGNSSAGSIAVYKGTVYTAGCYMMSSMGTNYTVPCYWAGTTRTDFPADVNNSGSVGSIAFKQ